MGTAVGLVLDAAAASDAAPSSGILTVVVACAHVAAGLVLVAGASKLIRPEATREALDLSNVVAATGLVRLLGVAEVGLALLVLLAGGPFAFGALAVTYAAFTVVAARQRGAGRGCGCFGEASTAVGPLHLVTNALAAVVAVGAAVVAAPSLPAFLPGEVVAAVISLLLLVTAVALARVLLTSLPELLRARDLATAGVDR